MVKHNALRYSLLLILILILLIVLGRFVISKPSPVVGPSPVTPKSVPVAPNVTTVTKREDSLTDCAQKLKKQTSDAGTAYDTHSILASFTPDTSFDEAVATIANYGLQPYHATGADISYGTQHIVTIGIRPGEEFIKICQLKTNPKVKNAILNFLFEIHE